MARSSRCFVADGQCVKLPRFIAWRRRRRRFSRRDMTTAKQSTAEAALGERVSVTFWQALVAKVAQSG
jgi:uncharacterized protein YecE (DUF72 family)